MAKDWKELFEELDNLPGSVDAELATAETAEAGGIAAWTKITEDMGFAADALSANTAEYFAKEELAAEEPTEPEEAEQSAENDSEADPVQESESETPAEESKDPESTEPDAKSEPKKGGE